jgi:hypothetical protein
MNKKIDLSVLATMLLAIVSLAEAQHSDFRFQGQSNIKMRNQGTQGGAGRKAK